jgi:hypothetical protein
MKREEIIEAIARALEDKPVCRCYTDKSRWQEDAEVAYDTAFPLIRDMVWEEAMGVVRTVVQAKRDEYDYPISQYGDSLHSEVIGADDVLHALMEARDLND